MISEVLPYVLVIVVDVLEFKPAAKSGNAT